jgi:hypothetical protein
MDEFAIDAFANRDDPIPVITFDRTGDLSDHEGTKVADKRSKKRGIKKILPKLGTEEKISTASDVGQTVQDRLLEKYA